MRSKHPFIGVRKWRSWLETRLGSTKVKAIKRKAPERRGTTLAQRGSGGKANHKT
jgi:hypothetical protein